MIISHTHRLIFVHIQKTAGTSVTVALDPFMGWNDIILGGSAFGEAITSAYRRRFGLDKHSTACRIRDTVGADLWAAYATFTVVREPAARLRSLYTWLGSLHQARWKQRYLSLIVPDLRRRGPWIWPEMEIFRSVNSLAAFIRHPDLLTTPGGMPQAGMLCDETGQVMVDHVFRTEALDTELLPFLRERGIALDRIGHRNASRRKLVARTGFSDADHALIRDLYARDYALFYPDAG